MATLSSAPMGEETEGLFAEATELQKRANELSLRLSSVSPE